MGEPEGRRSSRWQVPTQTSLTQGTGTARVWTEPLAGVHS